MGLSKRKLEYIREHFRRHSDVSLARALEVDKADVRKALDRNGLTRTRAEKDWVRDNPDAELPAYTGQVRLPKQVVALGLLDYLTAAVAAVVAMAVYLRTLSPTVTCEDGGELITAAYTLGIAHPPGYPIWCMLGKLFTFVPYGTIAWRVSFMSATLGVLTVFLVALLIIKLTRNRLAGIAGASVLAFSSEFWEQSVIAEVYSLNSLFVVACVFLLLVWYETRRLRYLYAFAVVYGLSLCNHNTMHFLGPVFVLFVLSVDREFWRRWKHYAAMAALALFVTGVVHIYLPIRSMANPPVDWGNPETWENFWDVIKRKQYAFGFTENPRTASGFVLQVWTFLKLYANEFTLWLCWLPLLGVWALWRKDKYRLGLLLGLFVYVSLGFVAVLNFKLDRQSIWLNNVFWLPCYIMAAVFIGLAIDAVYRLRTTDDRLPASLTKARPLAAAIIAGLAIAIPLLSHYDQNDKSDYYWAHDYGMNVLNTMEPDAIYFPMADHATFPALYLQAVEGVRPDITIANKYGYPEESLYEDMPFEMKSRFRKIPTETEEHIIEDWLINNTDRPVYCTKKRPVNGVPGATMVNAGLLYRVLRADETEPDRDYWAEYEWHTLAEEDAIGELTAEYILSDYYFARGRSYFDEAQGTIPSDPMVAQGDGTVPISGDDENDQAAEAKNEDVPVAISGTDANTQADEPDPILIAKALDAFDSALRIGEVTKESLNNVGSACAENQQYDAAIAYFERAIELDPHYDMAVRNLGKLYMQQQQWARAVEVFQGVLEVKPLDDEVNWLVVDCYKNAGNPDDALAHLDHMAQLAGPNARIYKEMGFIYLNDKQDPDTARMLFAKSLELDPNQPELAIMMNRPTDPMQAMPQMPGMDAPMPGAQPSPGASPLPNLPNMPQLPQLPQMPGQ